MSPTTEERIEIKAGASFIDVPFTPEGLEVVRAMVKVLEVEVEKPVIFGEEVQTPTPIQPNPTKPISQRRFKHKNWEIITKIRRAIIYKEVLNRLLEEYKEGVEPTTAKLSDIIVEMYGRHLKEKTIATYVSVYRKYITDNKLAVGPSTKNQKTNNLHIGEPIVSPSKKRYNLLISERNLPSASNSHGL